MMPVKTIGGTGMCLEVLCCRSQPASCAVVLTQLLCDFAGRGQYEQSAFFFQLLPIQCESGCQATFIGSMLEVYFYTLS